MADEPKHYWFPAKRYGWGWGVPTCWQGWVVMAVTLASVPLADRHPAAFLVLVLTATAMLIAICWIKGEPPCWRWGKD